MKSVQLVFGTHNHQFVSDHPAAYEEAYSRIYKPFLSVLNSCPEFPAVLYYCGSLLEWMEDAHPEFMMLLGEMVRRKQVELLGGGFYEPILTMIPTSDKLGQMEKMTTYLRTRFGTRPRGCWLTHQVWEPGLVLALRNSGMDFTFLEDRFFRGAGVAEDDLHYPRLTEDQGKTVVVFPICTAAGDSLQPGQVLDFLDGLADESGQRVAVLLLDGERLGRDDSRRCLFEEGGLARLLESILAQREWVHPMTPRRYLRQHLPHGRVYFSCLSDRTEPRPHDTESGKRRPQETRRRADREEAGAGRSTAVLAPCERSGPEFFRQHLTSLPEINLLYSRLLYTHLLVNQIRGDKYRKNAARNELWKGQSSAVFWDTRSGGIWANHLRKAAYGAFLEAEKIARVSEVFIPSIISVDFDMDGENEFLYQGENVNAFVHLQGGVVFELDYLPVQWNYQDTLARWPGLGPALPEGGTDSHWRKLFVDRFRAGEAAPGDFAGAGTAEDGDFTAAAYELRSLDREKMELILHRLGSIDCGGRACPLLLEKRYRFAPSGLSLQVTLTSLTPGLLSLRYGTEINLALATAGAESTRVYGVRGRGRRLLAEEGPANVGLSGLEVQDLVNGVQIGLASRESFDLWAMQVKAGPGSGYQCSCYIPSWQVRLGERESWQTSLELFLKPLE